jgi:hypothetical protein
MLDIIIKKTKGCLKQLGESSIYPKGEVVIENAK